MKILVVDAGNSRTKASLWTGAPEEHPAAIIGGRAEGEPGGEVGSELGGRSGIGRGCAAPLAEIHAAATPPNETAGAELARVLAAAARREGVEATVLISVVPRLDPLLAAALPAIFRVDHALAWPFALDVAEAATVGADRLANAAAAVAAGLGDAIVVDAGTATTFDVLRDGAFVGGLIAPGMELAARSLTGRAARLADQPFARVPLIVARDTDTAIRTGCYHVGRNGVLATLRDLRRQLGDPPVVFTGGLGGLLAGKDGLYDPSWTARGGAWLAERLGPT